eukprot:3941961-Rhodomonas_salina.15
MPETSMVNIKHDQRTTSRVFNIKHDQPREQNPERKSNTKTPRRGGRNSAVGRRRSDGEVAVEGFEVSSAAVEEDAEEGLEEVSDSVGDGVQLNLLGATGICVLVRIARIRSCMSARQMVR